MTVLPDGLGPLFVAIIVVYFAVILIIGYYGFSNTDDEVDYLVAGRDVGPVVGAATLSATQISAGTLVGVVGIHYLLGVGFIWTWAGLWTGWLVALVLVAPQMRRFAGMTVPDFIGVRYGDDGRDGAYARSLGALLIIAVYTVYLSAQITAGGLVLEVLLGAPRTVGMVAMVLVAVVYTGFGGMRASVLTDFVQAIVMVVGLVVAAPLALHFIGGIAVVDALLRSVDPELVEQAFSTADLVGFFAAFGLSKAAAPRDITRVYAMRDERTVRLSIGLAIVFQTVIAVSIALLGLTMRVMFPELSTPDVATVVMSLHVLGPVLGALLVAAVFSAILSTVDSVMLVSGAGLAHDIYAEVLNTEATERQRLWVNRIAVLVLGVVPLAFALNRGLLGGLIGFIVVLQSSMMGGLFFVPLVLGLHWRGANAWGAVAGMLSGFGTVIVWHVGTQIYPLVPPILTRYIGDPVIPGVLVNLVVLVVVSSATEAPSRRALEPFFDLSESDRSPTDD